MGKIGKIKYSEPKSFFPKDVEEAIWGNNSKKEKKPVKKTTKKPAKKTKK